VLSPSNYPALDKPPPTDSPQVQQWIQEVASTGIVIPNLSPTVLGLFSFLSSTLSLTIFQGGCLANPAAAADPTRCWWTCGGCVRTSDITECPDPLAWGLTYDDGPAYHSTQLLDYLDQQNLKTTFFVVGSRVISFPQILQTEYISGHQIAVHTWSHPPLTTLTNEEIIAELGWSKKVIKDVLGVTPNMMRPPYGDIEYALGLHVTRHFTNWRVVTVCEPFL
jgi:Polysaccharide deacetylase